MSDAVTALNGAAFSGAVDITDAGLTGMITLRGDLGSANIARAVKTATGLTVPGQRQVKTGVRGTVAWMSPDELFLMVAYDKVNAIVTKMETALQDEHALVLNVSDARTLIRLSGKGVREVLAKGAPVDLSPEAFTPGDFRRTRLGQVAVAFWMTGDVDFELVCFRSVGEFVFDWLSVAAQKDSLPGYL
jgi:sarcosine oxidase, subunit gamma